MPTAYPFVLNGLVNETVLVPVPEVISFPLNILSTISTVTVTSETTGVEAPSLEIKTTLNLKYLAVYSPITNVLKSVYVELSSDVAISICALQLAGVSPSKLEEAESKLPLLLSNKSSGLSDVCVKDAVILAVCLAPISITSAN